jgi:putative copper export protein/methionine-rich copper-binding protein CopC
MSARYGDRVRRVALTLAAVGAIVLGGLAVAEPAAAHDELVRATPADGSAMKQLPASGRLRFSEELRPADVTVTVGSTRLPVSAVAGDPRAVDFDLSEVSPDGTVAVTWMAVDSHDGHRTSGVLRWHVADPSPSAAPAPHAGGAGLPAPRGEPRPRRALELASKVVGYLAMALFVGGLLFLALLWPEGASTRRARVVLAASLVAGVGASAGTVAVVLWRAHGQTVGEALATDYGRAASATLLVWLLGAVVVASVLQQDTTAVRGVAWRVGAVVVSAGLIRVMGINAHATQGDHRTLGIAADFLHLTAVSAWVGGLVMLSVCLLPRRRLEELEAVVPRFSVVALLSVLAIVASGLLLLWDVSRGIDHFWATHYAHVLVLKLAIFALVMLAAMKSKRWVETTLAEAIAAHRRTAVRSFAVSVAAETVLVLAVLAAAGVLVTSSPGT